VGFNLRQAEDGVAELRARARSLTGISIQDGQIIFHSINEASW
jgi:hypothetical protein